jgi:hypothetical protein
MARLKRAIDFTRKLADLSTYKRRDMDGTFVCPRRSIKNKN